MDECTYFWGVNTSWGINTAESKRPINQEDNQAPQPTDPTVLKYEGYQLLDDSLLTYKSRFYTPNCDDLKMFITDELHKTPYTGNPGYKKMITSTGKLFYWPRMKKDIDNYLAKCLECQ
jgi:hypothetical protein